MAKEPFLKQHPWVLHVLIMLGISLVILFIVFQFIRIYARQGQEYELPDVVGGNIAELTADNPLALDVVVLDSIFRPGQAGGIILTQDRKPITLVKRGHKLDITVTAYTPEDAVLPELAGLTVRFVADRYKNSVIDQSSKGKTLYAGQQIERGTVVDLTVGLGDSTGRSVVPFAIGKTRDKARRDILSASLNVGSEHFRGVRDRQTAVVYRQEPDYTGVSRYPYGTSVELWYVDADEVDVKKMIKEFQVDSSKILDDGYIDDGRPSPDEIEERDTWSW